MNNKCFLHFIVIWWWSTGNLKSDFMPLIWTHTGRLQFSWIPRFKLSWMEVFIFRKECKKMPNSYIGILMVTCTDTAILCGNTPEACFNKYGSIPVRHKSCHEMVCQIYIVCYFIVIIQFLFYRTGTSNSVARNWFACQSLCTLHCAIAFGQCGFLHSLFCANSFRCCCGKGQRHVILNFKFVFTVIGT